MAVLPRPAPALPFVALAAIAALEGTALVGYAAFDLVEFARSGISGPSEVSNLPALILQVLIFLSFGVGLLAVGRGWWRVSRRARAPFLLAQLIALVVGFPLAQAAGSTERGVGIAIAAVALLGIAVSLAPAVNRALEEHQ
jgi:hypothetical protein